MCRQHFRMGINVDACISSLFQKHFQITQVVSGNKNRGIVSDTKLNFCDLRVAIGRSVGGIKQRHNFDAEAACFQDKGCQVIGTQTVI